MEKGLPYFSRMEKSLGNLLYLWLQKTFDPVLFVTQIVIAHRTNQAVISDPDLLKNPLLPPAVDPKTGYVDLTAQGNKHAMVYTTIKIMY